MNRDGLPTGDVIMAPLQAQPVRAISQNESILSHRHPVRFVFGKLQHHEQPWRLRNNTKILVVRNYSPLVRVWLSVVLVEDVYGLSVEGDVDGDVRVVAECVHGGEVA